jgi:EF hand
MRIRFVLASSGLSVLAVVLSTNAYPDTRNSDRDVATMERKASPSTAGRQDEERAEAHSQPDTPNAGGTTPRNTHKAKPGSATSKKKGQKESASTGSSAPSSSDAAKAERDRAFKALDLDGDGHVSKAEAAGNATLITRFDRADRNRDGKLNRKEYDALAKMRK